MNDQQRDFAMARDEAIAVISRHAPPSFVPKLIDMLRPSIAVLAKTTTLDTIPFGASRFGGMPDVGDGFIWPQVDSSPLTFFAQINLSETSPFDFGGQLPSTGSLLFFYKFDETSGQHIGKVIFQSGPLKSRFFNASIETTDEDLTVPVCSLTFEPEWSLYEFYYTELPPEWDFDSYLDHFRPSFGRVNGTHRILGFPMTKQDPPQLGAEIARTGLDYRGNEAVLTEGAMEWELLLQVDSQRPEWFLGDAGFLCFLIRREDLAARNWDQIYVEYQGG